MNTNISKFINMNTQNTALLVIDMQADFYAPDGKAAKRGKLVSEMQSVSGRVDDFAHALADSGVLVVLTKFIAGQGITPENLQIAVEKEGYDFPCIKGSGGEEFYEITPPKNATIIEKPHYDAFAYTNLGALLRKKHIRNVLVSGVRTEVCVDATAKRSALEGYETFIIKDLVATYDDRKSIHAGVLRFFQSYYGFVVTSREIESLLKIG